METIYIDYTSYRAPGASEVARRYIRDIEAIMWKYFDRAVLPGVSFKDMSDKFELFLRKMVGRHNPDFKIAKKFGREISFLVKTRNGWNTFGSLAIRTVYRESRIEFLDLV